MGIMNTPPIKRYERDQQRRLKAAELFGQDLSNAEVARRLHVSRKSASGWYQQWKADGVEGLNKIRMPGPACRLSQEQLQELAQTLLEGPQAQGYETPLWTLDRITAVIVKTTGVQYHPGHVWYMLQDLNWTCQKPEAQAKERDQAAVDKWLAEDWPRIKKGHKSRRPS